MEVDNIIIIYLKIQYFWGRIEKVISILRFLKLVISLSTYRNINIYTR